VVQLPQAEAPRDDLAVRVGEAIHNFRASLDSAIYALSGGKGRTQFPIEDREENFEARKTGCLPNGEALAPFLKGVPDRERDLIQAVQPYEGVDWSRRVRTLSNRDKHRELIVVNAVSGEPFTRDEIDALYPSDDLYPGEDLYPSSGHVEMHAQAPIDIALSDGVLVSVALHEIEVEIGALLGALEGS
jgi:hypothetical protein